MGDLQPRLHEDMNALDLPTLEAEAIPLQPESNEKQERNDQEFQGVRKLPAEETASFLLHRATKVVNDRIRRRLAHIGISYSEWLVLRVLSDHESLSMCDLSHRTHRLPSHITTLVDVLERKGIIQRVPDKNDRRVTLLQLTQEGRRFVEQDIIRDIMVNSPLQIPREKRSLLCQLLKEIVQGSDSSH